MKKYLLINAYSAKNRGDAGIVTSMIHLIREIDPNSEINVMSSFWKENQEFYEQYNANSIESIWNLEKGSSSIQRYLIGLKKVLKSILLPMSDQFHSYKEADIIISVGGGYLYSSRKGALGVGLLNSLYHIWLAKKFKKRVIGFPQSVGPLSSNIDKAIVKRILSKMDLFISREEITTELLQSMDLNNIVEIPDVGFTLPKYETSLTLNENIRYKVGITLLDWRFAKKGSNITDINNYVKKVADTCINLQKKYKDIHFYIFPQVTVGDGDTDLTVSVDLHKQLGENVCSIVNLESGGSKPEQLVDLYSKMDVFIGSRMHSTIFALAGETPTIALAYQYKTKGTFTAMGLEKYVYSVEDFSSEDIYDDIDSILSNKEYPYVTVKEKIADIKKDLLLEIDKIQ